MEGHRLHWTGRWHVVHPRFVRVLFSMHSRWMARSIQRGLYPASFRSLGDFGQRHHPDDVVDVSVADDHGVGELPFPSCGFLLEQMLFHGIPSHDFAGTRDAEPFGGGFVGLQLVSFLRDHRHRACGGGGCPRPPFRHLGTRGHPTTEGQPYRSVRVGFPRRTCARACRHHRGTSTYVEAPPTPSAAQPHPPTPSHARGDPGTRGGRCTPEAQSHPVARGWRRACTCTVIARPTGTLLATIRSVQAATQPRFHHRRHVPVQASGHKHVTKGVETVRGGGGQEPWVLDHQTKEGNARVGEREKEVESMYATLCSSRALPPVSLTNHSQGTQLCQWMLQGRTFEFLT